MLYFKKVITKLPAVLAHNGFGESLEFNNMCRAWRYKTTGKVLTRTSTTNRYDNLLNSIHKECTMQKITKLQIKTIAKEVVKLSKNNTPIQHSSVLEIISQSLGYRDYNALSNNVKNEDILISDNKDKYTVNEVSNADKTLRAIRTITQKLDTEKNTLSNNEIQQLEEDLKKKRLDFSRTAQHEDAEKRKKLAEKQRTLAEKAQYEEALEKFNNHYFSVLEVLSRSQGYKDYYSLRNSLKKEVPLISENMDDDIDREVYKAHQILGVINTINEKLKSEKSALSNYEIQKLEKELKILSPLYTKVLNKYEMAKKELKTCPNCNGQGEFILGLPASATESMHYDYEYGDYSAVAGLVESKGCFWCSETGKTSNKRIQQMKKMKRTSPKEKMLS